MYAVTKFEMEKRSLAHIEETYDLELLLLMAYRDLEKQFTKDPAKKQGQFQYEYGFVNFQLLDETGSRCLFLFLSSFGVSKCSTNVCVKKRT